jgi:hypothetical protein
VTGTAYAHPAWDGDPDGDGLLNDAQISADLGVILLTRPVAAVLPGVRPAVLPPAFYLADEALKASSRAKDRNGYVVVGYDFTESCGRQRPNFSIDFVRRRASMSERKFGLPSVIRLHGVPNSGPAIGKRVICSGDSGGAVFDQGRLVAVASASDCAHYAWTARLDTPLARNFLDDFIALP